MTKENYFFYSRCLGIAWFVLVMSALALTIMLRKIYQRGKKEKGMSSPQDQIKATRYYFYQTVLFTTGLLVPISNVIMNGFYFGESYWFTFALLYLLILAFLIDKRLRAAYNNLYSKPFIAGEGAHYTASCRTSYYNKYHRNISFRNSNGDDLTETRCHNCGFKLVLPISSYKSAVADSDRIVCHVCAKTAKEIFDKVYQQMNKQ